MYVFLKASIWHITKCTYTGLQLLCIRPSTFRASSINMVKASAKLANYVQYTIFSHIEFHWFQAYSLLWYSLN